MLTATKARTSAIRRGSAACGATGAITSAIRRGSAVFGATGAMRRRGRCLVVHVWRCEPRGVVFDQNVLPRGVTSKDSEYS